MGSNGMKSAGMFWFHSRNGSPLCVLLSTFAVIACADQTPMTPDAQAPDASTPDASTRDAQAPDAQIPDAQAPDAQTPDAQIPDARSDAGTWMSPSGFEAHIRAVGY